MIKAWKNCPLPIISKEERVSKNTISICKGSCNRMTKINNVIYKLCYGCACKYRFYGESCDVPNCESIAEGSIGFKLKENKIICVNCHAMWTYPRNNGAKGSVQIWERFVEERNLFLGRPPTFVKALEEGLISKVKIPIYNARRCGEKYTCHGCERKMIISNNVYQLCSNCSQRLQYYGEKCSIRGTEPCQNTEKISWSSQESRFVCTQCSDNTKRYNITSYAIYETQIRTITICQNNECKRPISHNKAEGEFRCSAYIDHDHSTHITRGVLCHGCNASEGMTKGCESHELWGRGMDNYKLNPPLSQSWVQKS
tara:strand:- start:26 stop:964 length:939 start_codon:yes stop_codon:yes gene_type:complete